MGNNRAGSSTRALAFERRLTFLERNRLRLLVLVAAYGALATGIGAMVGSLGSSWVSGLYWGAAVVGFLWAVNWFASLDGGFYVRAGAWAEEWTSEAIRKRLPDSYVIDDFPLSGRNLDHALVGPGGLYAIETKWRAKWKGRTMTLTGGRLEIERRQTASEAEELQQILLELGHNVPVRAALVLWGPGIPADEPCIQFGREAVFIGARWKDWPDRPFGRNPLHPAEVGAITTTLVAYRDLHSPQHKLSFMWRTARVAKSLLRPIRVPKFEARPGR